MSSPPNRTPRNTLSRPLRSAACALAMLPVLVFVLHAQEAGPGSPADSSVVGDPMATADSTTDIPLVPPRPASKAFGHLETGRALYETMCLPCHGDVAQGNADIGAPALNRQEPWYLLAQLRKFRSGLRGTKEDDMGGQMMAPMAMALADEQALLDVATYVASLEGPPPAPTLRGDRAAGERIFRSICAPCHGVDGAGRPEIRTPALLGQADWYVVAQLQKFRKGIRGYHELDVSGMQMRGMSAALANQKALVDVATYVSGLAR